MKMNTLTKVTTVLLISGSVLGGAYAANNLDRQADNDANAIRSVKLSMRDALQTVLEKVPGKPTLARLESDHGQPTWRIEVVADNGVFDMLIDADSGRVLQQTQDKADRGEAEDD
jgi:uncharacterized membrane protein YkoI